MTPYNYRGVMKGQFDTIYLLAYWFSTLVVSPVNVYCRSMNQTPQAWEL